MLLWKTINLPNRTMVFWLSSIYFIDILSLWLIPISHDRPKLPNYRSMLVEKLIIRFQKKSIQNEIISGCKINKLMVVKNSAEYLNMIRSKHIIINTAPFTTSQHLLPIQNKTKQKKAMRLK